MTEVTTEHRLPPPDRIARTVLGFAAVGAWVALNGWAAFVYLIIDASVLVIAVASVAYLAGLVALVRARHQRPSPRLMRVALGLVGVPSLIYVLWSLLPPS